MFQQRPGREHSSQAALTQLREHLGLSNRILGAPILGGDMDETAAAEDIAGELVGLSLQDEMLGALEMRRNDVSESVDHACARTTSTAVHGREIGPLAVGLVDMAGEVLSSVVCLLKQKDLASLGITCRTLQQVERGFTTGQQAFPLGPTVDDGYGNVDNAIQVDMDAGLLKKTPRPGMGTIMARERVDVMTCYWEVKIEAFTGVRLEIGVATRRSIYRGGHNMEECWVFDCFGRACHGSRVRGYGCKFKAGDVVGVLLNTADNSLYFFMQGKCMGTAFRNVRVPAGLGLYPLVVLPSVANETVRLVRRPEGGGTSFPATVRYLLETKRMWQPRAHTNDWDIVVETYDAQVIYRLGGLDPACTTVGRLKEALVQCEEMDLFTPGQLALRTKGVLLADDSALLSTLGVSFSSRGSQLQEIYLYVPHLIS